MAANNGAIVLVLGLAGIAALVYTRKTAATVAKQDIAAITAPPPIPATYNPMLPQSPARNMADGLIGGLFGALKNGVGSVGTSWASMPTGLNQQGQSTPLLGNNAFVSRM